MSSPKHLQQAASVLATVGGLGRVPWAPGSWGSAVGVLAGLLAVRTVSPILLMPLLAVSFTVCALICSHAERYLERHDPPIVILDEVWGMATIIMVRPSLAVSWTWLLAAFLFFRVFDIVKPPPLRQLAALPAGWGIMADDAGAAAYAWGLLVLLQWLLHWSGK